MSTRAARCLLVTATVAVLVGLGAIPGAWAAQPATTTTRPAPTTTGPAPTTTLPGVPLVDVEGNRALWFIGALLLAVALLWYVPLSRDARAATHWRDTRQAELLDRMIGQVGTLSVEEMRQIVSAIDTQPRGTQGLTQSLLGLIIATFVGLAMVATLLSTAPDSSDLRKTIVTALLSILATISGFYFGARTAQTSTEQATRPPESRPGTTGGGPSVDGIDPTSGSEGTPVEIRGSGFTDKSQVRFGDKPAKSVTVHSDQHITATAPAAEAGTVPVTVTTPEGRSAETAAARFTYTSGSPPTPAATGARTPSPKLRRAARAAVARLRPRRPPNPQGPAT
jgi:IPT/TIG domain